mmetsp:Transcript_37349/g.43476  ORF Transcript_37349/g.43476 Transcript_37349/m.43476 type:complete len:192 (-) Transcript_37349:643-1218(-)|eukprot:CAMPEP_0194371446 /NCGR_PEP_ID=MMETSP0174-20130528/19872_1 /TAXON_ID=216777 /ORGANISM="Proboscia alata, Strain PI-D3" /LENGTH=191 /DNA_ID=CAMNT_0039149525 /DNA_START=62 /DNA_END=637 /DNA_ORIENTATION=-
MTFLDVAFTWDGNSVPLPQRSSIRFEIDCDDLVVHIDAPYFGDKAPPSEEKGRLWELWEYEVVELFLAGPPDIHGVVEYIELEVGPHGHWLALRLKGTRNIIDDNIPLKNVTLETPYHIEDDTSDGAFGRKRWKACVRMDRKLLPSGPYRALATAANGPPSNRQYLSNVPLPGPEPNFHQLDRFTPVKLTD